MEQSPLTLQVRPETFEPKIVQLYRELCQDTEDHEKSEGFWRELFLLRPDLLQLRLLLDSIEADYLLHVSHACHELLDRCVSTLKEARAPSDEHALETLATFLDAVLSKRYQSPSADIIEVLAGLDHVDIVFQDLVGVLEQVINHGRTSQIRDQAVRVVLTITSGAFHTSLLTYFTQKDLFPALTKLMRESESARSMILPVTLIGVLANCNKFEVYNPYQAKIGQLSDDVALQKLTEAIAEACVGLRDGYTAVQDDTPKPWSLGGTLSYVGLGPLAGKKTPPPTLSEEDAKTRFAELPHTEAAMLLSIYEFAVHNKQFRLRLIEAPTSNDKHAHRSTRAALYSHLALIVLRIIVEDVNVNKKLCETTGDVQLCRQRPPTLPLTKGERPLAAVLMDVAMDAINHNLRTNLDVNLYFSAIGILLRITAFLHRSRTRLTYHWPELWRCLLSFVRFCSQYHEVLRSIDGADVTVHQVVNLITLCLTQGEVFLPDSAAVDDLFYKVIESNSDLIALNARYELDKPPAGPNIKTLMDAGMHFTNAFDKANGKAKNVSAKDVMKVIKDGYDTLAIEAREGTDNWALYREQDYKTEIKKITRVVVADTRRLAVPVNE